jgi:hypothetical protein
MKVGEMERSFAPVRPPVVEKRRGEVESDGVRERWCWRVMVSLLLPLAERMGRGLVEKVFQPLAHVEEAGEEHHPTAI